jgi:acetyl-CoA carboxylase carboxyltransferase component
VDPLARIEALADAGSVELIDETEAVAGDGRPNSAIAATAAVEGQAVVAFAQDGSIGGGSLGQRQAATLGRALDIAAVERIPVIGFVESAGARMQEGVRSLDGYARVFRTMIELSGLVPQISVATGDSAGGGCYCSALTDFTIMTRSAGMFLTGPRVVEEVTGEAVSAQDLGGHAVHRRTGVCQIVAGDELEAAARARELLGYLPARRGAPVPLRSPRPASGADPASSLPPDDSRVYDVRDVVAAIVDGGESLEIAPHWARNVVTLLARLDGRPIGVVANQPCHRAGVIDVPATEKASRFIRSCDSFGLPLVVLVDTPGFMPGTHQESAGIIRHGADLLRAFGGARVPRVTVILRRAFGGGYITMNSKDLGADYCFAWPEATIGILAARQAVAIVQREEIEAAPDPEQRHAELAATYAESQSAAAAVRAGALDAVVLPSATRDRLCEALAAAPRRPGAELLTAVS